MRPGDWGRVYWEAVHALSDCGSPTGMPPFYRGYSEIVPIPTEATVIPFPLERTRRPKGEHWFIP